MIKKIIYTILFFIIFLTFACAVETNEQISKKLQAYDNILIDLRGSRGGNGDVAAGYLTALDMIQRLHYKKNITFIIESERQGEPGKAAIILGKLLDKPAMKDGQVLRGGQIQIKEAGKIPATFPPADLYLSFANPTPDFSQEIDFVVRDKNNPLSSTSSQAGGVPIDKNTVLISQTVLGNTENKNYENSLALIRRGELSKQIQTAGLAHNEIGIYHDVIAAKLKDRSPSEIRQFLTSEIGHISNSSLKYNLSHLLSSGADSLLTGSHLTLAYGTTRTDLVKEQFESYLQGLVNEAIKKNTSFTIIMPSKFSLDDIKSPELQKSIKVFNGDAIMPKKAIMGEVQIITTGALPHRVFVGMIAYSAMPPVVAGDGALSAAITLGKPFVMTRVGWNAKNIENYSTRIIETPNLKADQQKLLVTIFPNVDNKLDLSEVVRLGEKDVKNAFYDTSNRLQKLTDNILSIADDAHSWQIPDKEKGIFLDPKAKLNFEVAKIQKKYSAEEISEFLFRDQLATTSNDKMLDPNKITQINNIFKWRLFDFVVSPQASVKNSEELKKLEKILFNKMMNSENSSNRNDAARFLSELNMLSKETIGALLKTVNSPDLKIDSIEMVRAVNFLFNSSKNFVFKTIINDKYLSNQFIELLKIQSDQYPDFIYLIRNRLINLASYDNQFLPFAIKAMENVNFKGSEVYFRQALEDLIPLLSQTEADTMIIKILDSYSIRREIIPPGFARQLYQLNKDRPLSPKIIDSSASYLANLKQPDFANALEQQLFKNVGIENVYLKLMEKLDGPEKAFVANKLEALNPKNLHQNKISASCLLSTLKSLEP